MSLYPVQSSNRGKSLLLNPNKLYKSYPTIIIGLLEVKTNPRFKKYKLALTLTNISS
jgi:hypothetical protein